MLEKFIDRFYRWAILIMMTFIGVTFLVLLFSGITYLFN
nr:MAG TPA: cytochrome c nitrite reductase [Caudoviricetes sp.]